MPRELKYASDMGVFLFPSFWMRVQRVIYRLVKEKPATMAAGLTTEALMNLHIPTVFDSFLLAKEHFVYSPPVDVSSFIPTHLFDFMPR
jgi:hypothetical protein